MAAKTPDNVQTVGRRKTAVARVLLRPGAGKWWINGRELSDYFPRESHRKRVEEPFEATELVGQFDVKVRVRGGGLSGQADAVRLGLARALAGRDEELRPRLRVRGLLTRDPRAVERKKPGRPKARKRFQFSKR
ncbi:MAG: 30S ribosomal protein S9 [Gemmatimonadota bacterium]|nr:30S ribosomal protein S9 [Gemmatimonadota bacterium]